MARDPTAINYAPTARNTVARWPAGLGPPIVAGTMIGLVTAPEATLRRVVFKVKTVKSDTVVHGSASDAWQTMVATPINAMVGRAVNAMDQKHASILVILRFFTCLHNSSRTVARTSRRHGNSTVSTRLVARA